MKRMRKLLAALLVCLLCQGAALAASEGRAYQFLTPLIGEAVPLSKHIAPFPAWWEPLVKDGGKNEAAGRKQQG